jgi:predicted RNase H-like HicB family nuclease
MDFYTFVLRKSAGYWVALCLENGIAGQGDTKEESVEKLKEAIESMKPVWESEPDVLAGPISIKELHEFLTIEEEEPLTEPYELRAVYA